MAKAKITITGTIDKKPKYNQDGTVDLIFKGSMTTSVPKGLKALGDSFYLVHVGPKAWKKVSAAFTDDSFLIVQGEPKANKTNNGTPLIEVVCFDISMKDQPIKKETIKEPSMPIESDNTNENESISENKSEEPVKINQVNAPENNTDNNSSDAAHESDNKHIKRKNIKWYDPEENIFEVPVNDIILTDKTHLTTNYVDFSGIIQVVNKNGYMNTPVAVRPLKNKPGKYTLVMGLRNLIIAKLLNFEKIKVVIRDMDHKQLTKSLGIEMPDKMEGGI